MRRDAQGALTLPEAQALVHAVHAYARALKAMRRILCDMLTCPITRCVTRDPVITLHGGVYDRSAIEAWISSPGAPRPPVDPLTRQPLQPMGSSSTAAVLVPVRCLTQLYDSLEHVMNMGNLGETDDNDHDDPPSIM